MRNRGHETIDVLQGGWDGNGSMLAIQLVKWWCRVQGVFRAVSAEVFTSTLLRWPSTLKCIGTRQPASSATPLSVVEPTCVDICGWNITCNGKKPFRSDKNPNQQFISKTRKDSTFKSSLFHSNYQFIIYSFFLQCLFVKKFFLAPLGFESRFSGCQSGALTH